MITAKHAGQLMRQEPPTTKTPEYWIALGNRIQRECAKYEDHLFISKSHEPELDETDVEYLRDKGYEVHLCTVGDEKDSFGVTYCQAIAW